MSENTTHFDDAAAYDLFMGRWSRGVGSVFLDWLAPPSGARWLEVGCGSGAFTAMVLDRCAPAMQDGRATRRNHQAAVRHAREGVDGALMSAAFSTPRGTISITSDGATASDARRK